MTTYFLRRLLLLIPTLLGITIMIFSVTRLVPGGPVDKIVARMQGAGGGEGGASHSSKSGQNLSEEQVEELKKFYGLDEPIPIAYGKWLAKIAQLDFGVSTRYQDPVWELVKARIPVSLTYGGLVLLFEFLFCIPLGILKAVRHRSWFDSTTSFFMFMLYAVPAFVIGIFLALSFGSWLEWFPLGGFVSEDFASMSFIDQVKDFSWHAALPLATYMAGAVAYLTQLMKNSLLDNLAADYVRTAIAKGLPFRKAVVRHALRNSLIPIATYFGQSIILLVTGSVLVELIFNIDGLALLSYEALVQRDYPVVMGVLTIEAVVILAGNILSDFLVAAVDPRVQFS